MSHNLISYGWVLASSMLAIAGEIIDQAMKGGTMGGQALLFSAVIVLGIVVIHLDKRRENNRTTERLEQEKRFVELMAHHTGAVGNWNAERVIMTKERTMINKKLLRVIESSTRASISLKTLIDERLPKLNLKNKS